MLEATFNLPVGRTVARDQQHGDIAERNRRILALYAQGWSYRQISAEVGLHWTRVGQILKNKQAGE